MQDEPGRHGIASFLADEAGSDIGRRLERLRRVHRQHFFPELARKALALMAIVVMSTLAIFLATLWYGADFSSWGIAGFCVLCLILGRIVMRRGLALFELGGRDDRAFFLASLREAREPHELAACGMVPEVWAHLVRLAAADLRDVPIDPSALDAGAPLPHNRPSDQNRETGE